MIICPVHLRARQAAPAYAPRPTGIAPNDLSEALGWHPYFVKQLLIPCASRLAYGRSPSSGCVRAPYPGSANAN